MSYPNADRFMLRKVDDTHTDVIRLADRIRYGSIFRAGNGQWAFLANHGVTIPHPIMHEIRGVVRGMQHNQKTV